MFVDPDNNDFRLQAGSPCIGSGRYGGDRGAIMYTTSVDDEPVTPSMVALNKNYPNPFNASTTISYSLPTQSEVRLDIYDILGRKLTKLFEGNQSAGNHSVTWDGSGAASGVYFYRLITNEDVLTERMTLVK